MKRLNCFLVGALRAGGGKSKLGCVWITWCCLSYPGTRYVIGRAVLKHLKQSTLLTLFDTFKDFGLESGKDYTYNGQRETINFFDGSEIFLKELQNDPSDPEFDKLGSTEFTAGFIDECSQVSTKAKNVLMSRLRYKIDEYNLVPKLLMCSNPTKNFLYYEFYKPSRDGTILPYRRFIRALVGDNPHVSRHYVENLKKITDKSTKERLLFGNWEYDDDPSKMFEYDKIVDMFTNDFVKEKEKNEEMYLICDAARFGGDRIVFMVWRGLWLEHIEQHVKQATDVSEEQFEMLRNSFGIPRSNCAIDEDGIGGGMVDHLRGVKGFVNGSTPVASERKIPGKPATHAYGNLKSQCFDFLAEYINTGKIGIYKDIPADMREKLIEELEQVKRKNADKDGKFYVEPKEKIKEMLGRSPDLADCMMMRMFFEVAMKDTVMMIDGRGLF